MKLGRPEEQREYGGRCRTRACAWHILISYLSLQALCFGRYLKTLGCQLGGHLRARGLAFYVSGGRLTPANTTGHRVYCACFSHKIHLKETATELGRENILEAIPLVASASESLVVEVLRACSVRQ